MCYAEVDPCFRALAGPHPVTGQRRPLASTVSVSWRKWYSCATATRPSWLPTEPTSTLTLSTCVCKTSGYVRSLFVNLDVRILGILLKGVGGKHLCTEVKQPHLVEFSFWQSVWNHQNKLLLMASVKMQFCIHFLAAQMSLFVRPIHVLRKEIHGHVLTVHVSDTSACPCSNCTCVRHKCTFTF